MTLQTAHSALARALKQAGYKLTRPRLAVLGVLQENEAGLSPEEIHRLGRVAYQPLGLVTVYRTLEILAELGLVRRVHSDQRCQRYALAGAARHYVVCQSCHRVVEFPCEGLESLIEGVHSRTGYMITDHLLELSGICPMCQSEPREV